MNASPGPGTEAVEGAVSVVEVLQEALNSFVRGAQHRTERIRSKLELLKHRLGPQGQKIFGYAMLGLAMLAIRNLGKRGFRLLTVGTATVYPIYSSFKALEADDDRLNRRWLAYWVCLGVAGSLEGLGDSVLRLFPSYHFLKLAFLLWLQRSGATLGYGIGLRPWLKKSEKSVDSFLQVLNHQIKQTLKELEELYLRYQLKLRNLVEEQGKRLRILT
mmetsp:Transcript_36735/g.57413  ORF Transcript_36735/g.57413 Transcript_36735/m.57413 type:complete len:217 (+) Transcript_36735:38-688(+)|eukprot:CAMPEP_0184316756 /NCGR_PEP_ID=MMETSP1049-20130417/92338_1 /TAXON_ID=77928 /ORGANISM="Proteomonas sulcata, Strain CCMP704" /LENGTH=216 /DNA_ID=CAMNT_0026635883 /DNA_START=30 /DNA_END=680 /DNA_ORIENTATION=+